MISRLQSRVRMGNEESLIPTYVEIWWLEVISSMTTFHQDIHLTNVRHYYVELRYS